MLLASNNYKGSVYRLVMVKRKIKTVYFVNCFNSVGFAGSVSFSTLCSAYKYFNQFKSIKKSKSQPKADEPQAQITNQNQVSLW